MAMLVITRGSCFCLGMAWAFCFKNWHLRDHLEMVKMGLSTPMAHGAHGAHGDVLRSRTSPDALNLTHGPFPFLVDWHGLAAKLKFWDSPVLTSLTSLTRFKVSGQSGQQDVLHFLHFSLDIFLGLSTDMPRYAPSWVFSEVMARSISKALANPKAKHGESALTAVTWPKILKNNGVPATNSQWSINGVWKVKVIRYKLIMIYDYYD